MIAALVIVITALLWQNKEGISKKRIPKNPPPTPPPPPPDEMKPEVHYVANVFADDLHLRRGRMR